MRYAVCLVFLSVFGLAGLVGVASLGLLSQESETVSPAAEEEPQRELIFEGTGDVFQATEGESASDEDDPDSAPSGAGGSSDDGNSDDGGSGDGGDDFGPGDGEPAVNFRFRLLGNQADIGVVSVFLNEFHLYSAGLAAPIDMVEDEGLEITITQEQVEIILGREITDPDLPPVTVTCVIQNQLSMGLPDDLVSWTGYLQGCWLEFPELAPLAAGTGDEPQEPLLEPTVDISSVVGQTTPIDVRLDRNTVYYMLVAGEDREAVLLDPDDPEIYTRAQVVAGGTFSWKEKLESATDDLGHKIKNLERLKYTPNADRAYLVLWALHGTAGAEGAGEEISTTGEPSAPAEENPRVNGWTRSAVYELTNGPSE